MKTIQLFIGFFLLAFAAKAQQPRAIQAQPVMDPQFYTVQEWMLPKEKSLKTIYLMETWNTGTIYLKTNQTIKGYKLNYDLENDVVEIETKDGIKLLPGNRVKQFTLKTPSQPDSLRFLNGDAFKFENIYNIGFYEVLTSGPKMQVFKKTDVEVIRANFNAITNTGSKTDKITKKDKVYLAANNKVFLLKGNDFDIFGSKADAVEKFAKTNKLKMKNPQDVAKMVNYYHSI